MLKKRHMAHDFSVPNFLLVVKILAQNHMF